MFKLFKEKEKRSSIIAPVTGKCIPITECSDPVFKDKLVGDGVAVIPDGDTFYAPCNGTVMQVAHSFHAVIFEGDDGLELLLHIGIDTVNLNGEGFTCFVREGQKVKAGDKLVTVDRDFILSKGLSLESPCVIANVDQMKEMKILPGDIRHGESPIIEYSMK